MNTSFEGKCSKFGGREDCILPDDLPEVRILKGMLITEGLAYFEHDEADLRPDLFLPRTQEPSEGTASRLRTESFYIALPITKGSAPRFQLAGSTWIVMNPKTKQSVMCSLVDWGPNPNTGRVCDMSPTVLRALRLSTDDIVNVRKA